MRYPVVLLNLTGGDFIQIYMFLFRMIKYALETVILQPKNSKFND